MKCNEANSNILAWNDINANKTFFVQYFVDSLKCHYKQNFLKKCQHTQLNNENSHSVIKNKKILTGNDY